jgi:nicotinamide-nucleotide amidase
MIRENANVKICCITIGNEILLGRTINTNLAYIGRELTRIGLILTSSITIPDEAEVILNTLQEAWKENDIIITTGGLGPTSDDITKKVIAEFFKKELIFSDKIWTNVQTIFQKRGISIPQINKNQAEVPKDFTPLSNIYGTAPGLYYEEGNKSFFALPGVPLEMKYLFTEQIIPTLDNRYKHTKLLMKTFHTFGIPESAIAELLTEVVIPEGLNLAYLPQTGRVDIRLYGCIETAYLKICNKLEQILQPYLWGTDDDVPDAILHREMLISGKTLSIAESCTGGLVQEMLTRHAGSSTYFVGGVVSYCDAVKRQLLQVTQFDLDNYGAVSKEVAISMAEGVRSLLDTDLGAGISGIAGPGGGTEEKPVGTVHIAVSDGNITKHEEMHFSGDRDSIRHKAAEKCIFMLYKFIKK